MENLQLLQNKIWNAKIMISFLESHEGTNEQINNEKLLLTNLEQLEKYTLNNIEYDLKTFMSYYDKLVQKYTCSKSVKELCESKGNYTPSFRNITGLSKNKAKNLIERYELTKLVNVYNSFQIIANDKRRAYQN